MIEYLRKLTDRMLRHEHQRKLRHALWESAEDLRETKRKKTEAIQEDLRTFCKEGECFTYLGIKMLCIGHTSITVTDFGPMVHPCIQAEYVDQQGRIQYKEFYLHELHILKQENTTPPTPLNNQTGQNQ